MGFKCDRFDPCACFTNPVICPTTPTTPAGLPAFLSRTNVEGTLTIGVNTPVAFNTPGVQVGTAITAVNDTTFFISEPGVYQVTYVIRTAAASLLGAVTPTYSGIAVPTPGASTPLITAGATLVGNFAFQAVTPGFLQLVITGLAITLALGGTNAEITISKIS